MNRGEGECLGKIKIQSMINLAGKMNDARLGQKLMRHYCRKLETNYRLTVRKPVNSFLSVLHSILFEQHFPRISLKAALAVPRDIVLFDIRYVHILYRRNKDVIVQSINLLLVPFSPVG